MLYDRFMERNRRRMSMSDSYLGNLLSHNPDLKSEEEQDYNNCNAQMTYVNPDCSYFSSEQHISMQSSVSGMYPSPGCTSFQDLNLSPVCAPPSGRGRAPSAMPNTNLTNPLLCGVLEQLPDATIFPGEFSFELSLGPHTTGATKSADYTYSHSLKKLYVQRAAQCPFKFKTKRAPPAHAYVRILPVFKGTHVLSEPVRRCSNHAEGDDDGPRYHFIRASNRSAHYDQNDSGRFFLTVPFTGPQVGAEYQVELLSFQCFNSCGHNSHSKRRIDVIFTLEHDGHVLGRQVIEVRVCACPGRDRSNEETAVGSGLPVKRDSPTRAPAPAKKRKLINQESPEPLLFHTSTNNWLFHQILQQVLTVLESSLSGAASPDQSMVKDGLSPASSTSSSGATFFQRSPVHAGTTYRPVERSPIAHSQGQLDSGTDEE